MTAEDVLRAAQGAGLTVTVEAKALAVRGPEAAKARFLPLMAQQARAIRKILQAGGLQAMPRCQVLPDAPCPACGYIHGTLEKTQPCGSCAATDYVVSVVSMAGDRLCGRCWRDG